MIYCLNYSDKERKTKIKDCPSWQKHGQGNGHRPLLYQKKKKGNSLTFKEKQHSKCVPELEAPGACICNDFWIFFPNLLNQDLQGWSLRISKHTFYKRRPRWFLCTLKFEIHSLLQFLSEHNLSVFKVIKDQYQKWRWIMS